MNTIKKIVVVGPESSGKTTLCKALATHYETSWIPEYARTYLEEKGSNYTYEDLEKIAKGQLHAEDEIKSHHTNSIEPVFLDTNLEVIKIWSHIVYGKCSHYVLNELSKRQYDFYLICKPDLNWTPDLLRENPEPENRWKHYHMFVDAILHSNTPFAIIYGKGDDRFERALNAVEEWKCGSY